MLTYRRSVLFGGAIVVLALSAAVVSILPQSHNHVAEKQHDVVPAGNVAHATESELEVTALQGTLSDFQGEVTRFADDIWVIEGAGLGRRVVRSSEGATILTVYFDDEGPETVAEIVSGTAGEFMDVLKVIDGSEMCNEDPPAGVSCIDACAGCEGDRVHCFCLAFCGCRDQGGLQSWGTDGAGGCWATCAGSVQQQ